MTTHHPIAIIGAGLGGLTLASVLHANGIESAVFDLDASPTARTQGGMLDIHVESGQAALRAAGLYDGFLGIIHEGGQSMRVYDKHGTLKLAEEDDGRDIGRPEVNRRVLRDLFLDSLPDGTIRWGSKVSAARPLGDGRHEVTFADGNSFTTDLLVGADGAWSKVRPLVSDAKPLYSGLSFVELSLDAADERHPEAAALVGHGMVFALGDSKGMLGHRDPDGSLHIYVALLEDANWSTSGVIDFADTEKAKVALLEYFADWDERLRGLISGADGALVPRPIHALPVGHRWDRVPGVTLLGDAAHVMSPFAGEGANLAMQDGAELAAAIIANHGRPGRATEPHERSVTQYDSVVAPYVGAVAQYEDALSQYEEALFPRAAGAAAQSAAGLDMCFAPDSPQGLLDFFQQANPAP